MTKKLFLYSFYSLFLIQSLLAPDTQDSITITDSSELIPLSNPVLENSGRYSNLYNNEMKNYLLPIKFGVIGLKCLKFMSPAIPRTLDLTQVFPNQNSPYRTFLQSLINFSKSESSLNNSISLLESILNPPLPAIALGFNAFLKDDYIKLFKYKSPLLRFHLKYAHPVISDPLIRQLYNSSKDLFIERSDQIDIDFSAKASTFLNRWFHFTKQSIIEEKQKANLILKNKGYPVLPRTVKSLESLSKAKSPIPRLRRTTSMDSFLLNQNESQMSRQPSAIIPRLILGQ